MDMEGKVTRSDIEAAYAECIVEGLDMESLILEAIDGLKNKMSALDDSELVEEMQRFCPHVLEELLLSDCTMDNETVLTSKILLKE